ncbi:hypothetical protein IAR55_006884 [Kwoniella newhampshirensis]|uniref:Peptidase S9 prolyl oligopeptidase catalytic domain-containing protein n=1 Tax=Kwoniella newhampshirensis TaxID=1651941 RepID=A0AAW0YTI0_9TREE
MSAELTLGHPAVSQTDLIIAGLVLKIHGLEEIKDSGRPLIVLIATHGRKNKMQSMAPFAQGILGEIASHSDRKKDLIVVTLDQRNHGDRIKDRKANLSFDENPRHLVDMAATTTGGYHDVKLIIDFLAPYLFPSGEKVIEEFVAAGISLGGYVTWLTLRDEPRVTTGINIVGLPFESLHRVLGPRAESFGLQFQPPTYPTTVKPILEPAVDLSSYKGKRILTMHGKDDPLVPFARGKEDIERIKQSVEGEGGDGKVEVWLQDDTGHTCTVEMVKKTADWILICALSDHTSGHKSNL